MPDRAVVRPTKAMCVNQGMALDTPASLSPGWALSACLGTPVCPSLSTMITLQLASLRQNKATSSFPASPGGHSAVPSGSLHG